MTELLGKDGQPVKCGWCGKPLTANEAHGCYGTEELFHCEDCMNAFMTRQRVQNITKPTDGQVGGDHYKKLGDFQPWQVMAAWMTPEELKGYMKGTVCAYLCREADKGGKLDIEKALHTMQIYLEVSK